ncbi:hypothetical protein [Moorena sp. SIO3H5]|uniref:hypothetical protein n=1 Tax=Moorena sp. SIO3H5 TaxID=2607834 RepID=UPI0013BC9DC7|nr:hypothetical protein [Moorena sp. SIO3H5]NEO73712.1 hypothetical protein [Moorena sp. SIO3H5]
MGRWGDGEMWRWGDGEMGRWGDGEMVKPAGNPLMKTLPCCIKTIIKNDVTIHEN